ncbi:helix-turn-helix domain-containing protein [Nocardioides sp. YIM 152588]|uniref:TetR/AcrR family transcriptional regulator n=1 Tax=Nocardioides sp. YIM 152588 TaxID=3158259 RepID=UPI0032E44C55
MTSAPARRPGRRNDVDVPTVLIDTAERMFGESSVDAVSLRAVAREAGVAPAAVTYHFPTKEALAAAVVSRRGAPVGEATRERLAALAREPGEVTALAVVRAILDPLAAVVEEDPEAGLNWLRVMTWAATSRYSSFYDRLEDRSVNALFAQAVSRATDWPERPMRRRTGIAMFAMLTALSTADRQGYTSAVDARGIDPEFLADLAAFTAAGLTAPLSD